MEYIWIQSSKSYYHPLELEHQMSPVFFPPWLWSRGLMSGLGNGVLPEASPQGSTPAPLGRESYLCVIYSPGLCLLSLYSPPDFFSELLCDCVFFSSCHLSIYSFIHKISRAWVTYI